MFFYEATDTPVLNFWWRLLWVSKPEWAALFALGEAVRDERYFIPKILTNNFSLKNILINNF